MAEQISLENFEDKSDIDLSQDGRGCQLCLEKPSNYTCPRCNVKYCSLECYRCEKHMECSELFYKNCVMQALQDETIDKRERENMLEILKRQREDKDEGLMTGEGATEDLEERLEGLNLDRDGDKIWDKLTEVERREFEKAVDTGYIGSLLEPWVPWWINREHRSSNGNSSEISKNQEITSKLPKILKNVPEVQTILKSKQPSSDTKYNLINILYSYAYICKFYNGCHLDFLHEAIEGLWKISAVLYHNVNFTSVDSALRSSIESSQQHKKFHNSIEFSLSVINDVSLLLRDGSDNDVTLTQNHLVELVLSDMYRLFTKGGSLHKLHKTTTEKSGTGSVNIVKSLWLARKKIYFMLAWFHENQDVCMSLKPFIPVVTEAINLEYKWHQGEKRKIEKARICGPFKDKKLIEEM